jgi:hypothetical protein
MPIDPVIIQLLIDIPAAAGWLLFPTFVLYLTIYALTKQRLGIAMFMGCCAIGGFIVVHFTVEPRCRSIKTVVRSAGTCFSPRQHVHSKILFSPSSTPENPLGDFLAFFMIFNVPILFLIAYAFAVPVRIFHQSLTSTSGGWSHENTGVTLSSP